jgi:hypothetical protein
MVAALLALLIPLQRLTMARPQAVAAATKPPNASTTVHLRITATAAPFRFEVMHLGAVIWRGESPAATAEKEVAMPFPPEGVDLALKVSWAGEQTAAVRLGVSVDGNEPLERTIWGAGSAEDVLTFK